MTIIYDNPRAPSSDNTSSSSSSSMIFNWDSPYRQRHMNDYMTQTARQMEVINNTFNVSDATAIRDHSGNRIINATAPRLWYRDNVALIFAVGCILNNTDRQKLDEILQLFVNDYEVGFLMNYHKILRYDTALVRALEDRLEISNGNYHVCLITVVSTNDVNILANAPESQYRTSGVVQKYCTWPEIYEYMQTAVARYGLVTEQRVTHDQKLSWEMGVEGLPVKTQPRNEVECQFDIDIDPNDESQVMLRKDLEFRREKDERFNVRQRNTKMMRDARDESFNRHRNRMTKNGSLLTRIDRDARMGIVDDEEMDNRKGVQLRMNEIVMPPDKTVREYQLFNDPDSYENGRNAIVVIDGAERESVPNFAPKVATTKSRAANRKEALASIRRERGKGM